MPQCGRCGDEGNRKCCGDESCQSCKGTGQCTCECQKSECAKCNDTGMMTCETCRGEGRRAVTGKGWGHQCQICFGTGKVPCDCLEKLPGHKNPDGFFSHEGGFAIRVVPDTDTGHLPATAIRDGDVITVANGSIRHTNGGTKYYGAPERQDQFSLEGSCIIVITLPNGDPYWVHRCFQMQAGYRIIKD